MYRGHPLVVEALQLYLRNPDMPAAEILRRAAAEHLPCGSDFESRDPQGAGRHPAYADELYPPSPFAELLRRAYAPKLDPQEAALLRLDDDEISRALQARVLGVGARWQREVIEPFFDEFGFEG